MEKTKEVLEKIEEIKETLKREKIQNIYLNFVNVTGQLLTKMVGVHELISNTHVSWFDGISLNGSLLEEFKDLPESDWLVLVPDPFSFRVLPFMKGENQRAGMLLCNLKNHPYDTRRLLQNAEQEFLSKGYSPMCGTQLIYSVDGEEKQGYYQTLASSPATMFLQELVNSLLQTDIAIEYYMPYGKKHQRIDLVPDIASTSADKLMTARWFAENLAVIHQKEIAFTNLEEDFLSSCPIHMSLWKGKREKNLFFDGEKEHELSDLGRHFMAGILHHQLLVQAMLHVCTQSPLKGYRTSYSVTRDDSILQVPLYFQEKQKKDRIGWSKRCVYQGLNADCNYYLMFACLLYAGLYGIENHLEIENQERIREYTNSDLIRELEGNDYAREKLGEKLIEKAIQTLGGRKG